MASGDEVRVISGEEFAQRKASLFSEEEEIILLKELQICRQKWGAKNDWKRFHDASQLKNKFSSRQLSEKVRRLRERFDKNIKSASPPPDDDPHKRLVFDLCKSLWGACKTNDQEEEEEEEEFPLLRELLLSDGRAPQLLRRNWGLIGREAAQLFEKRTKTLFDKQLILAHERALLKCQVSQIVANIINPSPPPPAADEDKQE